MMFPEESRLGVMVVFQILCQGQEAVIIVFPANNLDAEGEILVDRGKPGD